MINLLLLSKPTAALVNHSIMVSIDLQFAIYDFEGLYEVFKKISVLGHQRHR